MPRIRFWPGPLFAALLAVAWPAAAGAQAPAKKITYEQAYGTGLSGGLARRDRAVSWLDDGHYLVGEWDGKSMRFFRISASTGARTPHLDLEAIQKGLPEGFIAGTQAAASADMSRLIFNTRNDLYLYETRTRGFRRLTSNPAPEKTPRLSPDARYVAYTRDNDLYACDLETGLEHRLTADGSETILNGCESWVYMEEVSNRVSGYAAFWWSPDGRKIAFQRFDDGPVPVFNIVGSAGVHGALERQHYPKAGDPNPRVRVGIASLPEKTIAWADFDERDDEYLTWPKWFADSSRVVVQWMNRGQDEVRLFAVDPATGKKHELYAEKQAAWVEFFPDLHFFGDGSGFLLRTDLDGRSHLYLYDLSGRFKARLTQGDWDVRGISLVDEKNRRVYFTSGKDESTGTQLFRVGFDGRNLEQLTRGAGTHVTQVSPGGSYFVDSFTNASSPPRQALYRSDGTLVRDIPSPEANRWEGYALARKELFRIPTEDGLALPAYWILPPDFEASRKYPVLFQVYGGPAAPTVSDTYPSAAQLYLAQEGIIVMSVDHRGSGHFGKKGTALMHRSLGRWEMNDLIQAVKWLRTKPFVDAARIGITGSSYGGYATCLALTLGADYFTHGLAGSSVTDWKLYDSIYTERYMDAPAENKEGYEAGSVLAHAGKLKGVLLIEHGDLDDNVHLQNSVRLIDALIDEGKTFEFELYPNQRHGYGGKKREAANRRAVGFWLKHLLGRSNG